MYFGVGEAVGRVLSLPVTKKFRDEYILMGCFTLEGLLWIAFTMLDATDRLFGLTQVEWFGIAIGFTRGFFAGPFWSLLAHTITVSEHAVSAGMCQTLAGIANAIMIAFFNKFLSIKK